MEKKNNFVANIEKASVFIIAFFLLLFPLAFSTLTTEPFALPKQILLAITALASLVLFALKAIAERRIRVRRTPFDLPVVIFTISLLLSSLFAVNKADSITAFIVAFLGIIIYFSIVNIARDKKISLLLTTFLLLGGTISAILSILSFLKIYIFSYPFARVSTFTPFGSQFDQVLYFSLLFSIAAYLLFLIIARTKNSIVLNPAKKFSLIGRNVALVSSFTITTSILIALLITVYNVFYVQKPIILPFETGFQTAFAAISQDEGRTLKGFLFGSGLGTYNVDFSKFKQISFNQNSELWSLAFIRSSSFVLEILATAGIVSALAFIFILIKILRETKSASHNPIVLAVATGFAGSFFLPYSFTIQTMLFVLMALFAAYEGINTKKQDRFFDVDLQIVTLREGLLALEAPSTRKDSFRNLVLPVISAAIIFVMVLGIGYYSFQYATSDLAFQRSIVASSNNNGSLTYAEQTKAIEKFPYRDGFYRVYSQTNFALANGLAKETSDGKTLSQSAQENVIRLIQQSINSARIATAIAPQTALNWQNLSSIYRSLIGYGQNAENFAIASQQQAVLLDPNNPQQHVALGGIYYQLGQWDNAQNQFQVAIRLKPDFPNAYYNLGHALQEKKDIKAALTQYEIVKNLVSNKNPDALKQINNEIKALTSGASIQEESLSASQSASQQKAIKSLEVNKPSSNLPPTEPKIEIPPPTTATNSAR